jgi:hypothetical protein
MVVVAEPRSAKRDQGVGEALVGEPLGVLLLSAQRFEGLLKSADPGYCLQRAGWTRDRSTGTTIMVARALGRLELGVDLAASYCRAARWRVFDPGQAAKAVARTWTERQPTVFDHQGGGR